MNGLKTAALLCALLLIAAPAAAESEVDRGEYIRLHVVADDDSALKQGEKLAVRDSVRRAANALLADCGSADEAFARLRVHTDDLEDAALSALDGADSVSVEAGVFSFPDRRYGALFLPAGEYRAVRVVLGRGAGHNWWCVLYPSLCLEADGESEKTVMFYSSVARWIRSIFERNDSAPWPPMPSENVYSPSSWLNAPLELAAPPSAAGRGKYPYRPSNVEQSGDRRRHFTPVRAAYTEAPSAQPRINTESAGRGVFQEAIA